MLAASKEYVIPVVVVAVAPYVTAPAPWHLVLVAPAVNTGVPTVEVIVAEWVAVLGPLQPAAMAVITVAPLHEALYVTSPVLASIVLPAAILAASKL